MSGALPRSRSPYKGLMPYAEEDAPYFFGRETERDLIVANLLSSRLTLLYGPSGVGKSSVLYAGVARQLRALTRRNMEEFGAPEFVVVVFSTWNCDPVAGLRERVRAEVEAVLGRRLPEPAEPGLVPALARWTQELQGELLLVLDQFEEYFLYHPQEEGGGTFAEALSRLLSYEGRGAAARRAAPEPLRVSVLLSFREDALAQLDFFKGRIDHLFDNYLRLDYLTVDRARDALVRPIEQYNELESPTEPFRIEPELVEAVLAEVLTGKVVLGEAGRGRLGGSAESMAAGRVETPFLQLVMTRLWEREVALGSTVLRRNTLEKDLGGAAAIVRSHLDQALGAFSAQDRAVAARLFHYLVTPSGTKISYAADDLAGYAGVPVGRAEDVLKKLGSGRDRIVRQVPSPGSAQEVHYEIYHDKLAPAILNWRARYLRRRTARRNQLLAGSVSFVLLSLLALFALGKAREATVAEARASQSDSVQAVTQEQLVRAQQSAATAASPDGRYAVTVADDGGLRVLDLVAATVRPVPAAEGSPPVSGLQPLAPRSEGRITATAFDAGGTLLAAGYAGGAVRLWSFPALTPVASLPGRDAAVTHLAFSRDGRLCAAATADSTVRVWFVGPDDPATRHRPVSRHAPTVTRYDAPIIGLRFAEDGESVVALGEGGRIAQPCDRRNHLVFVGADRSLEEAETEAARVRSAGFSPTIYYHPASRYRTAVGPVCASEAERALPALRRVNATAYVLDDVAAWCPSPIPRKGYLDCTPPGRAGPPENLKPRPRP